MKMNESEFDEWPETFHIEIDGVKTLIYDNKLSLLKMYEIKEKIEKWK